MGYIPEAHQLPQEYRPMRDLLRQRMVMEHKRTILMQHAGSILAKFNITTLPVNASHPAFADFVATCQLPEEYRLTLLMYHHQCLLVTEHERHLERYFKSKLRPTPALQLLGSIPGIGDITGAVIAMETGDISRFADAKHYCSYCRLAPGARDSGAKHHLRSGSKDGNQYLKYAFTEAAIKAIMYYPDVRRFADRLRERANPVIARTVVAKELAKIVYYVLTRQRPCTTFKHVPVQKRSVRPRTCKPGRLTGELHVLPPA
jgi:transposase